MAALSMWEDVEQAPSVEPAELSPPAQADRSSRRRLVRRVVGAGVVAAIAAFGIVDAKAAIAAARLLEGVQLGWLGLALVAEVASLLSFCLLRRALFRATEGACGRDEIVAVTLAGSALSRVLPGGAGWAGVWAYGQLRRRGTDRSPAIWVLLVAGALSSFALFVIVVAGIEGAGSRGPAASLRWPAALLAAIPVTAGVVAAVLRRRTALRARAEHVVWRVEAHSAVGQRAGYVVRGLWRNVRLGQLSPARWLGAWLWGLSNWVFDGAVLVIGVVALGGTVPWRGVVVAYGVSQIATSVPLTPGGLGVAEASLAGLLVAYGMPGTRALAVVVLYRVVTLGVVGALGGGAWLHLRGSSTGAGATVGRQHEVSSVIAVRSCGSVLSGGSCAPLAPGRVPDRTPCLEMSQPSLLRSADTATPARRPTSA